jgi:hypothetical protein
MIQRRQRRTAMKSVQEINATAVFGSGLGNELLRQIAAGVRSFEAPDPENGPASEGFLERVRALEWLAASGLIMIGARVFAADGSDEVVAVRRIRLTEAGKRHAASVESPR